MEQALEQFFVQKLGLVNTDERRGKLAAHGDFDHFVVLGFAEQDADGGILVRLSDVAVEEFEVKIHLAEVLRLEVLDFQVKGDEALQFTMIKDEVNGVIVHADLEAHFFFKEDEVASEFEQEPAHVGDEGFLEFKFTVQFPDVEEFDQVNVAENISQQVFFRVFGQQQGLFGEHLALEEGGFDLSDEFAYFISFADAEDEVKEFLLWRGAAFEQFQVMRPGNAS